MTRRWRKEKGPAAPPDPDPAWLAAKAAADLQDFQTSARRPTRSRTSCRAIRCCSSPGCSRRSATRTKSAAGSVAGGALVRQGPDGVQYALIQAESRDSQMEVAGQQPVFDALDRALRHAREQVRLRL